MTRRPGGVTLAAAMIVPLGRRNVSEDVVDLLAECHGRIRRFLAMAQGLAHAPAGAAPAEVAATAAQIRRYFSEGLPLHVEDEDIDIAPCIPPGAASRVHDEHGSHEAAVAELIAACAEIERSPDRRLAPALVDRLARELDAHLVFEETVVFPAIRALDQAQQAAIKGAMRARRERHLNG